MKRIFFLLPLFALAARAQDTNDYVLRSDLAAYAERADLAPLVTHATLSNYSLVSDLSAYATASDLAGLATTASLSNYVTRSSLGASIAAYLASNPPAVSADSLTNYALRSDLSAYALAADLSGLATTASLSNYVTASGLGAGIAAYLASNPPSISTAALTNYALRTDLSAYATAADLAGLVTTASLSNYVAASDLGATIAAYLASNPPAISTATLANYALLSDLSAYATASDLDGFATSDDLAAYATTANLAAATAAVSNAFLHASPSTVGSNTFWRVPTRTVFDESTEYRNGLCVMSTATFADDGVFQGDASFDGSVTLGGGTRTNWNEVQSLTILDNEEVCPTVNDGFVWTFPEDNNCQVYLTGGPTATNRTRTVVIRHIESGGGGTATDVYDGPAAPSTTNVIHSLTATNPTAIFDWSPHDQRWYLR